MTSRRLSGIERVAAVAALAALAMTMASCSATTSTALTARAPKAISAQDAPDAPDAPVASHPTVVMIGDSIMKGHGLQANQAWPALLAKHNGWQLDNLACDGAGFVTVGDDSDCGETFAGLVAHAVALHAGTVIIEGSSNDFGQSDDELLPETRSQLAQLRAALPRAHIIGLSTLWGDTAVPAQLSDVDQQVRDAVTRVGGVFLAIGQPLSGHLEWMQSDDVHPTAAGQAAIYGAVQTAFDKARLHA